MERCESCGNAYDKLFFVVMGGREHKYDCFECAIEALAPRCVHCNTRVLGHGIEANGELFCCAHCARMEGLTQVCDRLGGMHATEVL